MAVGKLRTFLLCTVFVALVSLIVMFYYSVKFKHFSEMEVKYVETTNSEYVDKKRYNKDQHGTNNLNKTALNASLHNSDKDTEQSFLSDVLKQHEVDLNNYDRRDEVTQQPDDKRNQEVHNGSTTAIENHEEKELCPSGSKQVGPLYVNNSVPKMEDVEIEMSSDFSGWVSKGGSWKPTTCQARVKMALIIPYRSRYEQLSILLRHVHPMLQRQNLDYRIFVIEQAGDTIFNRAMLFNIGYKEALKFDQYGCFIFHDVDLIPEDDRNEYSCPSSPRHLSVAVDKFNYRLPYTTIFGGVGSFSKEHFELINGFSNKFWGWGGEDDDLYNRISSKGLHLTRPSMQLGRYKMIQIHHKSAPADDRRFEKLRDSAQRMGSDGLNSLKYTVEKVTEYRLYTLVTVDVKDAMENKR